MDLDVTTVRAITVLPFAIMALFLAWTWWSDRSSSALAWWSLALAFGAGSAVMTYLGAGAPASANVLVDDVLFLLAHVALVFGFRAFERKHPPVLVGATALIAYAAPVFLTGGVALHGIRIAIAIGAILTVVMIADFARWRGALPKWRGVVLGLLAVHLLLLVARFVTGPVRELPPPSSVEHWLTVLYLLAPVALPIAFGFTVLGMVFESRQAALRSVALRDPLTGALNRRGLREWLLFEGSRGRGRRRGPASLAAIAVDVDRFKEINDTYGHQAGDAVLKSLVATLSSEIRPDDALARFGGEEFVVLMPDTVAADAAVAAERMRKVLMAHPFPVQGAERTITASFGIAVDPQVPGNEGLARLLERADRALYRAKQAGRNQVVVDEAAPVAA